MSVRNSLDSAFEAAAREDRRVLIPYLTAGYPEPDRFVDVSLAILEAGADALEIGIPFSDPLLDGPAIQHSQHIAIEAGITPRDCLRYAEEIHARTDKPLLFMGAYNPILAYGPEPFCQAAAAAGVSALIVPDLPFEEQEELAAPARAANLHLIQLVAPTSTAERLHHVCSAASGFVYCISVAGVTGERASVADTARPLVETVRACTDVPVAVGFGIAGPPQAREVAAFADGVIVGAGLITLVTQTPGDRLIPEVRTFIAGLRGAIETHPVT